MTFKIQLSYFEVVVKPISIAMKIQIKLSPNHSPIPFDYPHKLAGVLHKWLGEANKWHGVRSLYGFSALGGGSMKDGALDFPAGATWQIGFPEQEGILNMMKGMMMDREVFYGMKVRDVREIAAPDFGMLHRFVVNSPILLRSPRPDGSQEHILWTAPNADDLLTARARKKLDEAGLLEEPIWVKFDRRYFSPKEKVVTIKGIKMKGSICPIEASGSPRALKFLWEVGAGELTGMGFGALR